MSPSGSQISLWYVVLCITCVRGRRAFMMIFGFQLTVCSDCICLETLRDPADEPTETEVVYPDQPRGVRAALKVFVHDCDHH